MLPCPVIIITDVSGEIERISASKPMPSILGSLRSVKTTSISISVKIFNAYSAVPAESVLNPSFLSM